MSVVLFDRGDRLTSGDFDTLRDEVLRMAGSLCAPLAEGLDVVHLREVLQDERDAEISIRRRRSISSM